MVHQSIGIPYLCIPKITGINFYHDHSYKYQPAVRKARVVR
jgi:hypothetical protein